MALHGELIGFNAKTGKPVYAAAGVGSYDMLKTDFYKTYQHENWQHPGSTGWSAAPVPGWGNNPKLQMAARRAMGAYTTGTKFGPRYWTNPALGCPECHISNPGGGCTPCPEGTDLPECQGCFDAAVEEGFLSRHKDEIMLAGITAIVSGLALYYAQKVGVPS